MSIKTIDMEDYKKKYEEALGWMKSIYPTMKGVDKEDAEHYFPELKESEDEKTRKSLISFLEELGTFGKHTNFDKWSKSDCATWVCWLEKQGEHDEYPRDVIENAISFLTYRNNGMPESEAKDIVNAVITVLNPKYWPQHIKRQKQEWSEEDERIISALSQLLKDCELENNWNCVYSNDREVFFVDMENWLKSLRPQNTWKPSDEQMEALKLATELDTNVDLDVLERLYQQLKAL